MRIYLETPRARWTCCPARRRRGAQVHARAARRGAQLRGAERGLPHALLRRRLRARHVRGALCRNKRRARPRGQALPRVRAHAREAARLGGPPGLLAAGYARLRARGRAAHTPPAQGREGRVLALPEVQPPARIPRGPAGRGARLALAPLRAGLGPGLRSAVGQLFRALCPGLRAHGGRGLQRGLPRARRGGAGLCRHALGPRRAGRHGCARPRLGRQHGRGAGVPALRPRGRAARGALAHWRLRRRA